MSQVRTRKRGKTFSYIFKADMLAYADWLHGNIGITSKSITLKDFMTKWLNEVVSSNVNATSLQIYQNHFDKQIAPYLGEVKVQELTPAMLDEWIRNLQKAGLAFNTISAVHAFIHNVLKYAVYPAQLIRSNPAEYIKAPKNEPRNVVKRHIISPEQFKTLLEKYPFGTPSYMPLLLLYHTGMRIREVLGLTWQDIDFAAKRINLWRQIKYQSKCGHFFQTLKSKSSERYILIDDYLLGELRRWQNQQTENEKKFGNSCVYIYREDDERIIRQSKGLSAPAAEKV